MSDQYPIKRLSVPPVTEDIAVYQWMLDAYDAVNDIKPPYDVTHTTSHYSMLAAEDIIYADGAINVSLPSRLSSIGAYKEIKNIGSSMVTVHGLGSDTIDSGSFFTLTSQYDSLTVSSDLTGWNVL